MAALAYLSRTVRPRFAPLAATLVLLAACRGSDAPPAADSTTVAAAPAPPADSGAASPTAVALAESDLIINGVRPGMSRSAVLGLLGPTDTNRYGRAVYPHLTLAFAADSVVTIELDNTVETARGLRIGDPLARMTALYGRGASPSAKQYLYQAPGFADGRGILIDTNGATVTGIMIGLWQVAE